MLIYKEHKYVRYIKPRNFWNKKIIIDSRWSASYSELSFEAVGEKNICIFLFDKCSFTPIYFTRHGSGIGYLQINKIKFIIIKIVKINFRCPKIGVSKTFFNVLRIYFLFLGCASQVWQASFECMAFDVPVNFERLFNLWLKRFRWSDISSTNIGFLLAMIGKI